MKYSKYDTRASTLLPEVRRVCRATRTQRSHKKSTCDCPDIRAWFGSCHPKTGGLFDCFPQEFTLFDCYAGSRINFWTTFTKLFPPTSFHWRDFEFCFTWCPIDIVSVEWFPQTQFIYPPPSRIRTFDRKHFDGLFSATPGGLVIEMKLRSSSCAEQNFPDKITWITRKQRQNLEIWSCLKLWTRFEVWDSGKWSKIDPTFCRKYQFLSHLLWNGLKPKKSKTSRKESLGEYKLLESLESPWREGTRCLFEISVGTTFLGSWGDFIVGTCYTEDAYQTTNVFNCFYPRVGLKLGQQRSRTFSWVLRNSS